MNAAVLGANGHIGAHLVRRLLDDGHRVQALVRETSDTRSLRGLAVDLRRGDVRDRAAIEGAIAGAHVVYHLATPSAADPDVERIAVDGTRHVIDAMPAGRPARLVYTSSTITVGWTSDPASVLDEGAVSELDATPNQVGKRRAESLVLDAVAQRGLDAVIVNPATTLGPLDYRPTPANKLVVDFVNGRVPFVFDGGFTLADVDDVAGGILAAGLEGRRGHRYILGGPRVSVADLYHRLAELSGLPRPRLRLPRLAVLAAAVAFEIATRAVGRRPAITLRLMRAFVGAYSYHSSDKAAAELGYRSRPLDEILERTLRWFADDTELVRPERRARLKAALASRPRRGSGQTSPR